MSTKTEEFIKKAIAIHGSKYDYNKTLYVHSMEPLTVSCRTHGDFLVRPNNHLSSKQGCQKCSKRYRPTLEDFVNQASTIHGDKYDYSKVSYVNNHTSIEIVCSHHGSFLQTPKDHIHKKSGCRKCANEQVTGQYHKKDTAWFITQGKEIHGNKYDYSKVDYKRYHDKVKIVCPDHGSFFQTASGHIHNKSGCKMCSVKNYEGGYGEKRFSTHPDLKEKPGLLYVIECHNDSEQFIKIGITQFNLHHRFHKTNRIPYHYVERLTMQGNLYNMFKIEQQLKRKFKPFKYKPTQRFDGHTECFVVGCRDQLLEAINTPKDFK